MGSCVDGLGVGGGAVTVSSAAMAGEVTSGEGVTAGVGKGLCAIWLGEGVSAGTVSNTSTVVSVALLPGCGAGLLVGVAVAVAVAAGSVPVWGTDKKSGEAVAADVGTIPVVRVDSVSSLQPTNRRKPVRTSARMVLVGTSPKHRLILRSLIYVVQAMAGGAKRRRSILDALVIRPHNFFHIIID